MVSIRAATGLYSDAVNYEKVPPWAEATLGHTVWAKTVNLKMWCPFPSAEGVDAVQSSCDAWQVEDRLDFILCSLPRPVAPEKYKQGTTITVVLIIMDNFQLFQI